jgi:hypothetical protein
MQPTQHQAHFMPRSAATNSGRMIHSDCASFALPGTVLPVDKVNHQQGAFLPFFGGA